MAYYVYELVSNDLREIFVSVTEAPDVELARLRSAPPPELRGWPADDTRRPRLVEVFDRLQDACLFGRRYAEKTPPPGWTALTGDELRDGLGGQPPPTGPGGP